MACAVDMDEVTALWAELTQTPQEAFILITVCDKALIALSKK